MKKFSFHPDAFIAGVISGLVVVMIAYFMIQLKNSPQEKTETSPQEVVVQDSIISPQEVE